MTNEAVDKALTTYLERHHPLGHLGSPSHVPAPLEVTNAFRAGWAAAMFEQQKPRARRGDPDTSHDAAASVQDLRRTQRRVHALLIRPLTDEQLCAEHVSAYGRQAASDSGVRSRRAELVDLGLVTSAGIDGKTAAGRRCKRWIRTEHAGLLGLG